MADWKKVPTEAEIATHAAIAAAHHAKYTDAEAVAAAQGAIAFIPTIFVAASDATAKEKAAAGPTYTCDGTADGAEIRAAIAVLAALPTPGGRVVLSTGTFNIAYGDDIVVSSHITISGQGPATILKIPDGQPDSDSASTIKVITNSAANDTDIVLENFVLDGNKANQPDPKVPAHYGTYLFQCYRSIQRGLIAHDFTEHGLRFHGSGGDTSECEITGCISHDNRWCGIRLSSAGRVLCANNVVRDNGAGETVGGGIKADGGIDNIIVNNLVQDCDPNGIWADNLTGGLIAGNYVRGSSTNGIRINQGARVHVSGNYLRENDVRGIMVDNAADHMSIVGNYITRHNDYGITLDGTTSSVDDCMINGNYFWYNGNAVGDTTIITVSTVNRLSITNNTIRKNAGGYGITIAAGADATLIKDNDLYDSGATDDISDGGTNTVIQDNIGYASPDDSLRKSLFDATTFLYATDDNTPQPKTPAEVLTILGFTATPSELEEAGIPFIIDGGGLPITTGVKGPLEVPFDCSIAVGTLLADQTGSIVVDIWVDSYANYPPTDADSITASAPLTISAATKSQDSTLTGWTKALTKGQIMYFNVDSCATIEWCLVSLRVNKT